MAGKTHGEAHDQLPPRIHEDLLTVHAKRVETECEQCLNDHVVLADQPGPLEGYGRGRSDLLILEPPAEKEPAAKKMVEQRRYRLRIQLRDPAAAPAYESIPTQGWIEAFAPLGD
jgi:hypothetical protein